MRSLLAVVAALALAATPPLGAQQQHQPAADRAALGRRLDSLARAWLASSQAPGVSVAVVRGRDTLLLEGLGLRDRERSLPATPATVYRVGSITKQFTAAAVMQLVERGRIGLADPMSKYFPEYPRWGAVTVRQLLDHTSGIPSYTSNAAWAKRWNDDLTPAQLVAFVEKDTVDFAPGTRWNYNNTGYVLLGMLLDRVTGTPYPRYVREHLFLPLGMRSAAYCPSVPTAPDDAKGYEREPSGVTSATYLSMTHPYSAGALCMNVRDYLVWQTALTGGRVVSPASYAMMSRSDTLTTGAPTNYGFGLVPGMLAGHRRVEHGGAVHGFFSEQAWFPDDSLRVVVFANATGVPTGALSDALAAAALGVELPPPAPSEVRVAVPLPAAERARYLGTYDVRLPGGGTLVTHVERDSAGGLVGRAEGQGQGAFPLVYLGNDAFGAEFDPTLRFIVVFADGKATALRVEQRGMKMEGPRRP